MKGQRARLPYAPFLVPAAGTVFTLFACPDASHLQFSHSPQGFTHYHHPHGPGKHLRLQLERARKGKANVDSGSWRVGRGRRELGSPPHP